MSAAERAEARRKAILSRGSDRLKKLTSSARGEDAPQFSDTPRPTLGDQFLGDSSSDMPAPATRLTPSPSPSPNARHRTLSGNLGEPDPSVWTEEQQQQFFQAIMGSMPQSQSTSPSRFQSASETTDPPLPSMEDNPLASMLQQLGVPPPNGPIPTMQTAAPMPDRKQKSYFHKLLPLLHLIGVWCLLAYFVIYAEPAAHQQASGVSASEASLSSWFRWADLATQNPHGDRDTTNVTGWVVQTLPFFWAFTTLQIAAHSMRIFSGFDSVEPPSLVAMAMPHLPPPIPTIIINGLKYWQMINLFMDDLAALLFGVGFVVVLANYLTGTTFV